MLYTRLPTRLPQEPKGRVERFGSRLAVIRARHPRVALEMSEGLGVFGSAKEEVIGAGITVEVSIAWLVLDCLSGQKRVSVRVA